MRLEPLPSQAAWLHRDVRSGFEVTVFTGRANGHGLAGHTTAAEDGVLWSVGYKVDTDDQWRTRSVLLRSLGVAGSLDRRIERDEAGGWLIDGDRRDDLAGCVDIDLESSAVTNTLPLHRLEIEVGQGIDVPAVFVRADDLRVERLEQRYTVMAVEGERILVHYESSTFAFEAELVYDRSGLVPTYPGLAERQESVSREHA